MIERIAPAIAHGDARLLSALVDLLDELFAAILGQLRQNQANHLTVIGRVDAQVGLLDRFFNRTKHAPTPRLTEDHACIGGTDVGAAVNRRRLAVVVDLNAVEQSGRGSTGANGLQVAAEELDRRGHLVLGGFQNVVKRVLSHEAGLSFRIGTHRSLYYHSPARNTHATDL